MKEFEKWSIGNPIREQTFYDVERRKAWRAALIWIRKEEALGWSQAIIEELEEE